MEDSTIVAHDHRGRPISFELVLKALASYEDLEKIIADMKSVDPQAVTRFVAMLQEDACPEFIAGLLGCLNQITKRATVQ